MTFVNVIGKLSDVVFKLEKLLVMVLITVMFVSLTAGVFFRYYFNSPLFWSDEIAIFTLIWLTFIGGSMSIKRQQSAAVTIFVDKLNEQYRKVVVTLGFLIILVFCIFLLCYSFIWLSSPNIGLQTSSSIQIPMIYPYLCVPLGFLFMSVHSIHLFIQSLKADS
ncbi:TRAP transporter small permease [Halalkalibacterium ligniniphilum]|uniref:TRAP transporter small permease n=1 Tax=Halalkalibacterium ligniniphilum TaxID=1134413 RepID=UPI00037E6462|nr:TRAP transporter small permease [Halalkalibacterium ligniniphilum]